MADIKYKIFPFAPGITWKLKNNNIVIPELSLFIWNKIIATTDENKIIIALNSKAGLLESFYSLTLIEAINQIKPKLNLFWSGDNKFKSLLTLNQLATPIDLMSDKILNQFPTPIFLDKNNTIYFNCMNNYLFLTNYSNKYICKDTRAVIKQINEKSCLPWDNNYLPKLRNQKPKKFLIDWMKINNIRNNSTYILIIPDSVTEYSKHTKINCLKWNSINIKALAAMLAPLGIITIVATSKQNSYLNNSSTIKILPFDLENILYLMIKCYAILSKDIDYLMIALTLSTGKIIGIKQKNQFRLQKNQKFLGELSNKNIFTFKKLDVMTAFNVIINNE